MSNYKPGQQAPSGGKTINTDFQSQFGSHESMIDEDLTALLNDQTLGCVYLDERGKVLSNKTLACVCRDERGAYLTLRHRTKDCCQLADGNRNANAKFRMAKLTKALSEGTDLKAA